MITVTSAEAAKILQKLNDERNALLEREDQLAWFLCVDGGSGGESPGI